MRFFAKNKLIVCGVIIQLCLLFKAYSLFAESRIIMLCNKAQKNTPIIMVRKHSGEGIFYEKYFYFKGIKDNAIRINMEEKMISIPLNFEQINDKKSFAYTLNSKKEALLEIEDYESRKAQFLLRAIDSDETIEIGEVKKRLPNEISFSED